MATVTPDYIVLHTAAHWSPQRNKCFDTSAEEINRWHLAKGWKGIGYHFVVRWNGDIEKGRPTTDRGAHVAGLNHRSLGICFSGCGDHEPLTEAQLESGLDLIRGLMAQFKVPAERVIGHREHIMLIEQGVLAPRFRNPKSCPGKLVNMDHIRALLSGTATTPPTLTCNDCQHCNCSC